MDYFIADLHLGHNNIISLCNRPFTSISEMDEKLINLWNVKVKKLDTVYIIGDLIWEKADALSYIQKLKGKKVLIYGNHDKKWLAKGDYSQYFEKICPYLEIKSSNIDITLCHYPLLEWNGSRKIGSKKLGYHIYGHLHNRYQDSYKPLFMMPHALNAGADINNFEPVTLAELIQNNQTFKLEKLPTNLDKAEFLATKYHLYQVDKVGTPYIEHPKTVSGMLNSEDEKIVGWLHDTLEDTDIDLELLKKTFSPQIIEAVLALTHDLSVDYFDYIKKVKQNPIAKSVKRCDLTHNMDLSRFKVITDFDLKRQEKYQKALKILNGEED